jgi:hypothetical protein
MASIFSKFKDPILDFIEDKEKNNLRFPLRKTGNIFNNYTRGFIIVGGRKTSGKALLFYIICNFTPHSKNKCEETRNPFDVKLST